MTWRGGKWGALPKDGTMYTGGLPPVSQPGLLCPAHTSTGGPHRSGAPFTAF